MQRNVGGLDRVARVVLTVSLTVVAVAAFGDGRRVTALVAGLGALGLGFNATTGFCGVNAALGIDTTRADEESPD